MLIFTFIFLFFASIFIIIAFVFVLFCMFLEIEERLVKKKKIKHRQSVYKNFAHKWLTPLYFPKHFLLITSQENGTFLEEKKRSVKKIKSLNRFNTDILEKFEKHSKENFQIPNPEPGQMVRFSSAIKWELVNIDCGFLAQKYSIGPNNACTIPRAGHNWVFEFNLELFKNITIDKIIPDAFFLPANSWHAKKSYDRTDLKIGTIGIYLKDIEINWDNDVYFGLTETMAVCMFEGKYYFVKKHDLELI